MYVKYHILAHILTFLVKSTGFKLTVSLQTGTLGGVGRYNCIILPLPANWSVCVFTCMFTNNVSFGLVVVSLLNLPTQT